MSSPNFFKSNYSMTFLHSTALRMHQLHDKTMHVQQLEMWQAKNKEWECRSWSGALNTYTHTDRQTDTHTHIYIYICEWYIYVMLCICTNIVNTWISTYMQLCQHMFHLYKTMGEMDDGKTPVFIVNANENAVLVGSGGGWTYIYIYSI